MVWDEEVRTLAMTASRMLKGSMVYTTKMIKRKNDTYREKENIGVSENPGSLGMKGGRKQHAAHRRNIITKEGGTDLLSYNRELSLA